ncbi:hypothetical protein BRD17_05510 [Halobacteriales archaeon SW_7_68_16]|nr:MAG: hypothetical protein BRD17_05510 [Halobacteriales archaeon SW_7_68_16]
MIAGGFDGVLREITADVSDELYFVNPDGDGIEELVRVATEMDDPPRVRLLADKRTLKSVVDDFIVASNAADLVDAGALELRTGDLEHQNTVLVAGDRVAALVSAGGSVGGLVTDDAEFVADASDEYEARWGDAEAFNLRTPPISQVRQTLSEEISPEAEQDFENILSSLETARGDGDGLDEVTISLLVAAKNEALLYDVSKWGEDVGIASKATFSRTKTKLEDMGLIDTEKVPIDVGRPRLRLKIGDDRLKNADNGQLATIAQSLLN